MTTMKIEVDISALGLVEDPETGDLYPAQDLTDRLVAALVRRFEEATMDRLGDAVADRVKRDVEERVKERVEGLLEGTIQPTDRWGHNVGEPTSVEAITMAAVEKWIRPGDSRSGYSGNNRGTLGELVEQVVEKHAKSLLEPALKEAGAAIKGEVVQHVVKAASEALASKAVRL